MQPNVVHNIRRLPNELVERLQPVATALWRGGRTQRHRLWAAFQHGCTFLDLWNWRRLAAYDPRPLELRL